MDKRPLSARPIISIFTFLSCVSLPFSCSVWCPVTPFMYRILCTPLFLSFSISLGGFNKLLYFFLTYNYSVTSFSFFFSLYSDKGQMTCQLGGLIA